MHQTLNPSGEKFCGDQRYIRLSLMENCEVGGRVGPADHILECRAARNQSYTEWAAMAPRRVAWLRVCPWAEP